MVISCVGSLDVSFVIDRPILSYVVYQDIYIRYVTQRFMYGPEYWIDDYSKINEKYLNYLLEY